MQWEKSELLTVLIIDIKRRMPVANLCECLVMGHIGVRHYLAEFSRNLNAIKRDIGIVGLYVRVRPGKQLPDTNQDEED